MKKTDFMWILAYPIYQLFGTARHEAGHALVALAQGERIRQFVFWPTQGRWGYVMLSGSRTAPMIAGPYLLDALTFLVFFALCMFIMFKQRWLWINSIAVGIISPLVNSAFNYAGFADPSNDVGWLLRHVPPTLVHAYFWMTLTAYLIGLILVFTSSRMARATRQKTEPIEFTE